MTEGGLVDSRYSTSAETVVSKRSRLRMIWKLTFVPLSAYIIARALFAAPGS